MPVTQSPIGVIQLDNTSTAVPAEFEPFASVQVLLELPEGKIAIELLFGQVIPQQNRGGKRILNVVIHREYVMLLGYRNSLCYKLALNGSFPVNNLQAGIGFRDHLCSLLLFLSNK